MGTYFYFACVDASGRKIASFNPQHGFGGLKWGEFVGTLRGDRMLSLLQRRYCPDGCCWCVVDDTDGSEWVSHVRDFAWNCELRDAALAEELTTPDILRMMDDIAEQVRKICGDSPNYQSACISEFNLRSRVVRRLAYTTRR